MKSKRAERQPEKEQTDTLKAIRREGARLILERSYSGMGLRDLAAAIGLQAASLYNHIENKQQLLFSIIHDHMLHAIEGVDSCLERAGDDPERRLRAFVTFHVEFHTSRSVEAAICLSELRSLEGRGRKIVFGLRDAYQAKLSQVIQDGVAQGVFGIRDSRMATLLVLGAITSVLTWYKPKAGMSARDIAERYADLLLDGLRARRALNRS